MFSGGLPLKLLDLATVEINLWWLDVPVSKVLGSLYIILWLVNIRSMKLGLLDWKHVASLIRLVRLYSYRNLQEGISLLKRLKSLISVKLSWFF